MAKVKGTHVSPGVYTDIVDLSYAAKTVGITKLGLVGETTMGPAFEPMPVTDWADFKSKFGGTSTDTFYGSKYPKYELPYIAKSYLEASDQLQVCRVLGLSGYDAGPAFVIAAVKEDNTTEGDSFSGITDGGSNPAYAVAVIRSKGSYNNTGAGVDFCSSGTTEYDKMSFDVDDIVLEPYTSPARLSQCETTPIPGSTEANILLSTGDFGTFKIVCKKSNETVWEGVVSFNKWSKDYIYNVIGSTPEKKSNNTAPIYIEDLYDFALQNMIETGKVKYIKKGITYKFDEYPLNVICDPVSDLVNIPCSELSKRYVGQMYLSDIAYRTTDSVYYYNYTNGEIVEERQCMQKGYVYVVVSYVKNGVTKYCYTPLVVDGTNVHLTMYTTGSTSVPAVKVASYGTYFAINASNDVVPYFGIGDYHEQFRCATTPWFVSELKGDGSNMQVKKLFRLHTITDGKTANKMIKVTISDIRPDEGLFNLQIRDYNDSDASPIILESYRNLTMEPGNLNYIGLQIGTLDGSYETVSNYVLAEVIENSMTRNCVPCGFLGYPVRNLKGASIVCNSNVVPETPSVMYNTEYNEDINDKRQYFGLSDIDGNSIVDVDLFTYKGSSAYTTADYKNGMTSAFHLDSTINTLITSKNNDFKLTVDGDNDTSAITWTTVSPLFSYPYTHSPKIGSEEDMEGCLFENKKLRKFTAYPYGGFDGWDEHRTSRTNTDAYKYNKYKGAIKNGYGYAFSKVSNPDALSLDSNAITTDYYAYLAGIRQFEIPEKHQINLFATPGIDYVNNTLLVNEVLDMIETKRGDSLYVVTTPDKPFGSDDTVGSMYTPTDAVDNLDASGIDTYYAATYYPWVKYFDDENNMFVNLPATKDVLRNMADVDNKRYPWIAPAGIERGNVECKKMHFFAKLDDEDTLYNGLINPLKTFSNDGVKVWGNKTMYSADTPMNRINTVRLVLYMRYLITKAANRLIFDQNDPTLKNELEDIINPILAQIKSDRGIYKYKLVTSQTPEQIDAHEISGKLWVAPTPALEYINLSFIVTPYQVEFEDI